jgi:GTPase SAR1 family protein
VIILVGNKLDLLDERCVSDSEAQEFAKRYNLEYLETSAKSGDNVTDAFVRLGQEILRQVKKGTVDPPKPPEPVIDDPEDRIPPSSPCGC